MSEDDEYEDDDGVDDPEEEPRPLSDLTDEELMRLRRKLGSK